MLTLLLLLQDGWTPDSAAVRIEAGRVAVQSEKWAFAAAPGAPEHAELSAELVVDEPARRKNWFGEHWSVWPDLAYDDGGYDAGLLLRGGYRVQLSHALQDVALVKVPDGGYLRVAPCPAASSCRASRSRPGSSRRRARSGTRRTSSASARGASSSA